MNRNLILASGIFVASLLASVAGARAAAATRQDAASDWNIVGNIPLERVVIQSHRGAGVLAEENTLAAFELGWKLGTYPEADVRTTADGVIVAFHDADFKRVVKNLPPSLADKGVQHVSWEELKKLDVGSWKGEQFMGRRVSTINEVFEAMRGKPERHLYLDIKQVDLNQLAKDVISHGVQRQVVLASPQPEPIREWKNLVPESDTLLWMRGSEAELRKRIAELEETKFAGITQLQIHIFPNKTIEDALAIAKISADRIGVTPATAKASAEPFTISRAFIIELGTKLRAHHVVFQSLPYTNDTTVYAQLLDLGMMSFATDYPDVTMREMKLYYEKKHAARSAP